MKLKIILSAIIISLLFYIAVEKINSPICQNITEEKNEDMLAVQETICNDDDPCTIDTTLDGKCIYEKIQNCNKDIFPCNENWTCTDWTICKNITQRRICSDGNLCGTETKKPTEIQNCREPVSHVMIFQVLYDTDQEEWIQLYNPTQTPVDIKNWTISDNSGSWNIPEGTIEEKTYFIIAHNGFNETYDCQPDLTGFTRGLNDNGDQLELKDNSGNLVDFVAWEKGYNDAYTKWTIGAKRGFSIVRENTIYDTDTKDDWISSTIELHC